VSSYQFALNALDLPLLEARTVAISVLVIDGLYLILALEGFGGRRGRLVAGMCAALLVAYVVTLALPPFREFFELAVPTFEIAATAVVGALIAVAGLELMSLREPESSPAEGSPTP
jgi:hypothetical protein